MPIQTLVGVWNIIELQWVTLSKKAKSELVAGGPAGVKSGQIWVEPSQKFCISLR